MSFTKKERNRWSSYGDGGCGGDDDISNDSGGRR